jgi:large subunit ribosomal protein L31e
VEINMAAENKKTIEREYIIPLRREWLKAPKHKRAKKALRAVREFLAKHMKADIKEVKIGKWINNELWRRGIRKPAAKIKVKVSKDEKGTVRAELFELPEFAKKIEAKLKEKESKSKKEKKEEKKEEEKAKTEEKVEEAAKEEVKETPEEKEKESEEKIMHKEIKKADKSHAPKDEHMHVKTKLMRTD